MKRFSWLMWTVMVSCGGAMSLAACGDDDGDSSIPDADGGPDALVPDADTNQADGTGGGADTGSPDVHVPDSGSLDGRAPDGGDAGDSGIHDSGTQDSGDSGHDSGVDSGVDSGKPDSGPDAGPDSGSVTCGKSATGPIGAQMPAGANVIVPTISYEGCSGSVHATDTSKPPVPAGAMGKYALSASSTVNGFFRITGGDVHTTLSPELNAQVFDFVDPMFPLLPFGMTTPSFNAAKAHIAVFYGKKNDTDKPCSAYNVDITLVGHPEAVVTFADEAGNVVAAPPSGTVDTWAVYSNIDPSAGFATFTYAPKDPVNCVPAVGIFTGRMPIEANAISFLPGIPIEKKKKTN